MHLNVISRLVKCTNIGFVFINCTNISTLSINVRVCVCVCVCVCVRVCAIKPWMCLKHLNVLSHFVKCTTIGFVFIKCTNISTPGINFFKIWPFKNIPKAKSIPEMSSVTSKYLENMYHNGLYGNKFWAMRGPCYPIWPTAAILDFDIQLVSLDISFPMALGSFYAKGDLCIMTWSQSLCLCT